MKMFTQESRASLPGHTRGLTLIEVAISMLIVAVVLLATARAFGQALGANGQARRTTGASVFLETTMEDIGTQPFATVLTLDGETLFDAPNLASSNYSIHLQVFLAAPSLLQISAELTDLHSERVIGRLVSQRSRR